MYVCITDPTTKNRIYADLHADTEYGYVVDCVLSEADMIDFIMCRVKGIPEDERAQMLMGFELIEHELQEVFGICGDVNDLACKIHDRMEEIDGKVSA